MRCATCNHYAAPTVCFRPNVAGKLFGECRRAESYYGDPEQPETMAFAESYDGSGTVRLRVLPDFGCVMYEAKQ